MSAAKAGVSLSCAAIAVAGCVSAPPEEKAPPEQPSAVVQPVREPEPAAPARAPVFAFAGELTQGGWIRGTAPGGAVRVTLDGTELPIDAEGRFFAAFDRDAERQAQLVATLADGRTIASPLSISPRAWDIEHIDAARAPGGMTEAFWRIREPELARIAAARGVNSGSEGWRQDFAWPVTGRISGRFGSPR